MQSSTVFNRATKTFNITKLAYRYIPFQLRRTTLLLIILNKPNKFLSK